MSVLHLTTAPNAARDRQIIFVPAPRLAGCGCITEVVVLPPALQLSSFCRCTQECKLYLLNCTDFLRRKWECLKLKTRFKRGGISEPRRISTQGWATRRCADRITCDAEGVPAALRYLPAGSPVWRLEWMLDHCPGRAWLGVSFFEISCLEGTCTSCSFLAFQSEWNAVANVPFYNRSYLSSSRRRKKLENRSSFTIAMVTPASGKNACAIIASVSSHSPFVRPGGRLL